MAKKIVLFKMLIIMTVFSILGISCHEFFNGTFTLTDIPSEYNGKYVFLESDEFTNGDYLLGARGFKMPDFTGTLPRITNGSVRIPIWYVTSDEEKIYGYKGNTMINVEIVIFEKAEVKDDWDFGNEFITDFYFTDVTFTNGNAKKSFKEHYDWEE